MQQPQWRMPWAITICAPRPQEKESLHKSCMCFTGILHVELDFKEQAELLLIKSRIPFQFPCRRPRGGHLFVGQLLPTPKWPPGKISEGSARGGTGKELLPWSTTLRIHGRGKRAWNKNYKLHILWLNIMLLIQLIVHLPSKTNAYTAELAVDKHKYAQALKGDAEEIWHPLRWAREYG